MKKQQFFSGLIVSLILMQGTVCASSPNRSYNETSWTTDAAAPDAYVAMERYNGYQLGTEAFLEPKDICTDEQGNLYIADTGNNRIVMADSSMTVVKVISEVYIEGTKDTLKEPQGVCASGGYIYVADTGNARALKMNLDGTVLTQYLMPDTVEYTAEFFSPVKLEVDKDGMVFVLCESVYQGLLLYTNDGQFQSFFGSTKVQVSAKVLIDQLWKKILSQKQRESMADYVPTEYENLTIDKNGFVYVCCLHTDNNVDQIRKLNYLGNNIFPYEDNFGEKQSVYYEQTSIVTTFVDVAVSEQNVLYGLDSTRGRIYAFDQNGNRLFTFGASGAMKGAFQKAASLATFGDCIFVLDSQNATITSFTPTEYGQLILQATDCYAEGQFDETQALWEQLLQRNINLELAYSGMGEALLKSGDNRAAMQYFRRGNNPERESVAFAQFRSQLIREHPVVVSLLGLCLLIVLLLLTRRRFWQKRREKAAARDHIPRGWFRQTFHVMAQVLRHPIVTMTELKYKRYHNWFLVGFILIWWFFLRIALREWTGFRFQTGEQSLNIFLELLFSVVPFVLFCVSNWACSSILDGEGRFDEICTFTAMAMIPYLLIESLGIPISNILCLAERDFFLWFLRFGILWSAFLVFQAVRITQQYSSLKTILLIILSFVGIAIILFLLLLVVALVQQMYSFGITLYSEWAYQG